MKITSPDLNVLSIAHLTFHEQKYQQHNVAIHRGVLQHILLQAVGKENTRLNKRLVHINLTDTGYVLCFEDGTKAFTEYLIGADGIHSKVRTLLFEKSHLRDAKQVCWRGVCRFNILPSFHHELNEAWGKGKRFGFVRIDNENVYWYALANTGKADKNSSLLQLFQDFHPIVCQLIETTPAAAIFYAELYDLAPIARWHTEKVCLIGDAAHATTPNLGQGACQAIEDAYILGELFGKHGDLTAAFTEYPSLRAEKANHIVMTSRAIGKLAHLENILAIKLRNLIMKATPKSVTQQLLDKIFTLEL